MVSEKMKKIFMAISGHDYGNVETLVLEDSKLKEFYNEETEINNLKDWDTMTEEQKEEWFLDCDKNNLDGFLGIDHFTNAFVINADKHNLENLESIIPIMKEMI